MEKKLFMVEKTLRPEWGKTQELWTQFFLAKDKDTLEEAIIDEYGSLRRYYTYDRCEEIITISERECKEI